MRAYKILGTAPEVEFDPTTRVATWCPLLSQRLRSEPMNSRIPLLSNRSATVICSVLLFLSAGCASLPESSPNAVALPLETAWYDGQVVHYVSTDVSDIDIARKKGVNFSPLLAGTLAAGPGKSALARVYAFVNGDQPTVFNALPNPVGPDSRDATYSPLWRMVEVRRVPAKPFTELKSEEALLAAEERGEVSLTLTSVIINCPVVMVEGRGELRGARLLHLPRDAR